MRKAVDFGNILVHEYVNVSDDVVLERLSDVSDLQSFVRSVAGMLGPPA